MSPFAVVFAAACFAFVSGQAGPTVVGHIPANFQTGVLVTAPISVTFDMPVQTPYVLFTVDAAAPVSTLWLDSDSRVSLTFARFSANTNYTVYVQNATSSGGIVGSPYSFNFSTGSVPTVVSLSPTTSVPKQNAQLTVQFSEAMETPTIVNVTTQNDVPVAINSSFTSSTVLVVRVESVLAPTTPYIVTVFGTAASGEPMAAPFQGTVTTEGVTPIVNATTPMNGTVAVRRDQAVLIEFTEIMDTTATISAISVSPFASILRTALSNFVFQVAPQTNTAWGPSTAYTITVSTAARALNGAFLGSPLNLVFETVGAAQVASINPTNGEVVAPTLGSIALTFNTGMSSVAVSVNASTGAAVPGTVAVNGLTATFTPTGSFAAYMTYTVGVTGTAVGNLPLTPFTSTFTTSGGAGNPHVAGVVPAPGANVLPGTISVVLTFSGPMSHAVTDAAVTITPALGGAVFAWNAASTVLNVTGVALGDVRYTGVVAETATDIYHVNLTSTFTFNFTTHLMPTVVSIFPAAGSTGVATNLSAVNFTFNIPMERVGFSFIHTVDNTPVGGVLRNVTMEEYEYKLDTSLEILQNYTITVTGTSTDGVVMPAFVTTYRAAGSPAGPSVVSTFPQNDSVNVHPDNLVVQVLFSVPMLRDQTQGAFSIAPAVTILSYSWDAAIELLSVAFAPMAGSTTYVVAVSEAAVDKDGTPLSAPLRLVFSTAAVPSVVAGSEVPLNGAVQVPLNTSATMVAFSTDMNATTLEYELINLATGVAVPATVHYADAAPPNPAVASLHFANDSLSQLTVYEMVVYGSSNLNVPMRGTFISAFRTMGLGAPTVVSVTPAAGSRAVPVSTAITVAFSQSMDTILSTVAVTFIVEDEVVPVNGTAVWSAGDTVWTLTPSGGLWGFTNFTVSVTGVNADGTPMAGLHETWFRTIGVVGVLDINPANRSIVDYLPTSIDVTFTHPVEPGSVALAFRLYQLPAMDRINVTVLTPDMQWYSFYPDAALAYDSLYAVIIEPTVVDDDGTRMQNTFWSDFGTSTPQPPAPDVTPPPSPGLTGGAIAGIVIACVVFAGLVVGGVVYFLKCRRPTRGTDYDELPGDAGKPISLLPSQAR